MCGVWTMQNAFEIIHNMNRIINVCAYCAWHYMMHCVHTKSSSFHTNIWFSIRLSSSVYICREFMYAKTCREHSLESERASEHRVIEETNFTYAPVFCEDLLALHAKDAFRLPQQNRTAREMCVGMCSIRIYTNLRCVCA